MGQQQCVKINVIMYPVCLPYMWSETKGPSPAILLIVPQLHAKLRQCKKKKGGGAHQKFLLPCLLAHTWYTIKAHHLQYYTDCTTCVKKIKTSFKDIKKSVSNHFPACLSVFHAHLVHNKSPITWNTILTVLHVQIRGKCKIGTSVSNHFPACLSIFYAHTLGTQQRPFTWNTILTVPHLQN